MKQQQGNGIYALMGAAAVFVVAVMVGTLYWEPAGSQNGGSETSQNNSKPNSAGDDSPESSKPQGDKGEVSKAPQVKTKSHNTDGSTTSGQAAPSTGTGTKPESGNTLSSSDTGTSKMPSSSEMSSPVSKQNSGIIYPTFGHVRIEPNGDNVFSGRVAPGATVELMRDGEVYARAVADTSGLFAFSAPALPAGPSSIYLQSISPDGTRENSKESVTVMINRDKKRRPLVALVSPDKPTVVLSNPDSPDSRHVEQSDQQTQEGKSPVNARPSVQISTVETRNSGRLLVSGSAAPGASVKLYLNGTMVAPGGADSEGRVFFAIAKGMVPGDYVVRIDEVDPVSNAVKSKSEVKFNLPDINGRRVLAGDGKAGSAENSPAKVIVTAIETETVGYGDSLWKISERRYGNGYLYLEIYDANLRKIKDPDVIYPGQILVLPPLEAPQK
ncbi:LysM peptidoglycan-binding domain-containing protein [Microvirga sp. W0021]|uniref:LysM peptidoglycan-binding domain-containing protein n=1 Tax=Hohaiivirga grylli TaxID=3133970 RepID=A0ABV0BIU8_9HYPH